ncbi:ISLre2 family transposase, partial [Heyndrickxia coagulans]|nr:ISLre2 family transposase [Heyndrickxia coagulans]
AFKQFIGNGTFKQNIRAFVLSLAQWGLIVEAREIYETPAGKASQERPRSEVRARRLAGRPRKASDFRAPQHPRYPSLYRNITSFPKITPSK